MCTTFLKLWKHEWKFGRTRNAVGTQATGECFHNFFQFPQTFMNFFIIIIILKLS